MKFIKNILIISAAIALIGFAERCLARMVKSSSAKMIKQEETKAIGADEGLINEETKKVETATLDAQKAKESANAIIAKAKNDLAAGNISLIEASKIIGEQNYKIEQANKQLAVVVDEAIENVEMVEAQEGYTQKMLTGIRSIGESALAPFKAGYGYTEQEKAIARAIIEELTKQLKMQRLQYAEKMMTATQEEKNKLNEELEALSKQFEKEIMQQQLVTGEAMSLNRRLFWGAVGLAGAVALGAAAKYYLGTQDLASSVTEEQQDLSLGLTPYDVTTYGEAKPGESLIEKGLERLATAEQIRTPEEQPFGGLDITEGTEEAGKTLEQIEQTLKEALEAGAKSELSPESYAP